MAKTAAAKPKEKTYLKWYNKVGYGSGDLAANMVYGLLTSFVMIYLTDTVGLNSGVIGTLIMASKFFDGFTDIIVGNLMDKTHSKMGKARPWMLYSQIGNSVFLAACFMIPMSWGQKAQYAYFFIAYTMLNAIFYTANNIAYAALTSLITRNNNERVQVGTIRFMFSLTTNIVVASITVNLVNSFGGGAAGWRTVAIIYALIGLIVNTISVMSVRELPPEDGENQSLAGPKDEISILQALKILFSNKYFIVIVLTYIGIYLQTGFAGIGIYYMTYILKDPSLLGTFSMMGMFPMVLGLIATPFLVQKFGMYKTNIAGYIWALVFRVLFIFAGLKLNGPMMLAFSFLAGLGTAPLTGDMNALISSTTDYTYKTKGVHVEGAMFSASSVGIKVGGGIGTALSGLMLSAGGYIPNAATQPQSCINMLNFMYLFFPLIVCAIILVLLTQLNVEKANADWDAEHAK